jgi:hypothetical protein
MQGSKCIVARINIINRKKSVSKDNAIPFNKIEFYLFSKKIVIQIIIKIGNTCLIISLFLNLLL